MIAFLSFICVLTATCAGYPTKDTFTSDVWTFPLGTWVENLALRSNGHILATSIGKPEVWEVDPSGQQPALVVATIPNQEAVQGITEVEPDVFYVAANNFSLQAQTVQRNASAVYRLDFSKRSGDAVIEPTLVTRFDDSALLNGATTLDSEKGLILVGDSILGHVWLVDVYTGEKEMLPSNALFTPTNSEGPNGVNGMKFWNGLLYFSNWDQSLLANIPISIDRVVSGPAQILANLTTPDDILVLQNDRILVAGSDEIRLAKAEQVDLLSNSALLKGSTAVAKGIKPGEYFVSTSGGDAQYGGNVTVGGKIVRLSVDNI